MIAIEYLFLFEATDLLKPKHLLILFQESVPKQQNIDQHLKYYI